MLTSVYQSLFKVFHVFFSLLVHPDTVGIYLQKALKMSLSSFSCHLLLPLQTHTEFKKQCHGHADLCFPSCCFFHCLFSHSQTVFQLIPIMPGREFAGAASPTSHRKPNTELKTHRVTGGASASSCLYPGFPARIEMGFFLKFRKAVNKKAPVPDFPPPPTPHPTKPQILVPVKGTSLDGSYIKQDD